MPPRPSGLRSFDPRTVGRLECATWVTYYRREWWPFLRAPYPGNDPDGARRNMRRFYSIVARTHGEALDPGTAARLEVEWWRVHRF